MEEFDYIRNNYLPINSVCVITFMWSIRHPLGTTSTRRHTIVTSIHFVKIKNFFFFAKPIGFEHVGEAGPSQIFSLMLCYSCLSSIR